MLFQPRKVERLHLRTLALGASRGLAHKGAGVEFDTRARVDGNYLPHGVPPSRLSL